MNLWCTLNCNPNSGTSNREVIIWPWRFRPLRLSWLIIFAHCTSLPQHLNRIDAKTCWHPFSPNLESLGGQPWRVWASDRQCYLESLISDFHTLQWHLLASNIYPLLHDNLRKCHGTVAKSRMHGADVLRNRSKSRINNVGFIWALSSHVITHNSWQRLGSATKKLNSFRFFHQPEFKKKHPVNDGPKIVL